MAYEDRLSAYNQLSETKLLVKVPKKSISDVP